MIRGTWPFAVLTFAVAGYAFWQSTRGHVAAWWAARDRAPTSCTARDLAAMRAHARAAASLSRAARIIDPSTAATTSTTSTRQGPTNG